jgi:hypothetical protein
VAGLREFLNDNGHDFDRLLPVERRRAAREFIAHLHKQRRAQTLSPGNGSGGADRPDSSDDEVDAFLADEGFAVQLRETPQASGHDFDALTREQRREATRQVVAFVQQAQGEEPTGSGSNGKTGEIVHPPAGPGRDAGMRELLQPAAAVRADPGRAPWRLLSEHDRARSPARPRPSVAVITWTPTAP